MTDIIIQPIETEDLFEALGVFGEAFATLSSSIAIYKDRTRSDVERCVQIMFNAIIKYQLGQVFIAKYDRWVVGVMNIVGWLDCQMKPSPMLKAEPTLMKVIR